MNVFILKIIACVAMLIDHFGAAILLPVLDEPGFNSEIYIMMRSIGRIAFPIFAYLIAQGCVHTKDIGRYLFRLGLFAIVSEPFFDIGLRFRVGGVNFLADTNIFYTLFLGAAGIVIYKKVRQIFLNNSDKTDVRLFFGGIIGVLAASPAMIAAWLLTTDYAHFGVGIILLIYILGPQNRPGRSIAVAVGMIILYFDNLNALLFSLVAVVLIDFYNGKLGPSNAVIKWGFYFFYPAHIAALIVLRSILLI
jgi:hypothetical protein